MVRLLNLPHMAGLFILLSSVFISIGFLAKQHDLRETPLDSFFDLHTFRTGRINRFRGQ